jgi:hypothetical protein
MGDQTRPNVHAAPPGRRNAALKDARLSALAEVSAAHAKEVD